ncbi:hypothetical protein AOLI_G00277260 [Acnodon oligacanthus]
MTLLKQAERKTSCSSRNVARGTRAKFPSGSISGLFQDDNAPIHKAGVGTERREPTASVAVSMILDMNRNIS